MPFNAIPAEDFLNRENELHYLKGLSELKKNALGGDVFLEGARGMGKTELLKQLYRLLYWEGDVVPFYYSFKTANLKGAYFAKDYFSWICQTISLVRKKGAFHCTTVRLSRFSVSCRRYLRSACTGLSTASKTFKHM